MEHQKIVNNLVNSLQKTPDNWTQTDNDFGRSSIVRFLNLKIGLGFETCGLFQKISIFVIDKNADSDTIDLNHSESNVLKRFLLSASVPEDLLPVKEVSCLHKRLEELS